MSKGEFNVQVLIYRAINAGSRILSILTVRYSAAICPMINIPVYKVSGY